MYLEPICKILTGRIIILFGDGLGYRVINELNRAKWVYFLKSQSHSNIFQTPYFFDLYNYAYNQKPVFLAVINERTDELLGLLLAVIQAEGKGLLNHFTARSIIMGGPLIKDDNPKTLELILQNYNFQISGKTIYSQIRNFRHWDDELKAIFLKQGFNFEPHLDILCNLNITIEKQWMKLHQGRRKNIRRACKKGLSFGEANNQDELEKAYMLVKNTYKRLKIPMPAKSFFDNSFFLLIPKGHLKIFLANFNNEIIATRMVLCYKDRIYDWYAGASDEHLDKYPNDYLPWKIMEWGTMNGYKTFDFGGAGKPDISYGVRDYKIKFGGELVNWGRFEKVNKPVLMNLGKLGLKLYRKVF